MRRSTLICLLVLSGCAALPPCPGGASPAAWSTAATVVRVVDGDTIVVETAQGSEEKVRLKGIDCPEASENSKCRRDGDCADDIPRGRAATLAAQTLLPRDARVVLVSSEEEPERDRYGRLLAYVEREGEDVGFRLVEAGHCADFSHKYPHPRAQRYLDAM